MEGNTYQTLFDASEPGIRGWEFPALGLLFVIIGAVLVFGPQFSIAFGRVRESTFRRVFNWLFFGFACLWTLAAASAILRQDENAKNDLQAGRYQIVEGDVENFRPMPSEGHSLESFDVNGVPFSYSDNILTPGFNNTSSHGGPIRNGLPVRIAYKKGDILKLEVRR